VCAGRLGREEEEEFEDRVSDELRSISRENEEEEGGGGGGDDGRKTIRVSYLSHTYPALPEGDAIC